MKHNRNSGYGAQSLLLCRTLHTKLLTASFVGGGILTVVDYLRFELISVLYYCIVYYWFFFNRKQKDWNIVQRPEQLIENILILGGRTKIIQSKLIIQQSIKLVNIIKVKIYLKVVFHLCALFTSSLVVAHIDHAIRILKKLFDLKSVHFALFTRFFNDQNFFWTKNCRLSLFFPYGYMLLLEISGEHGMLFPQFLPQIGRVVINTDKNKITISWSSVTSFKYSPKKALAGNARDKIF